MTFATTYVQVPPLTEHSGVSGMAAVPGAAWGEQPSTYPYTYPTTTWPAPTDQWEWAPPPVDPQNYSGGGMPPAAVYPTGSVPLAAPIPTHTYPPPSPGAPFDARNYAPPDPGLAPFDPRNYVPPNSTPMQYTYEPRTSESAFNNSMQLYGGGVASPVIPPASYMLSPQLSRSSSGGSYPYASASGLSRSASTREHGAWLYDRPGSWSPRFQMSRSGVGSLVPSFTRGRSFPPGPSYDLPVPYLRCIHPCYTSRYDIADFGRTPSLLRTPGAGCCVGHAGGLCAGRVPRIETPGYELRPHALYHGAAYPVHETVSCAPAVVHRSLGL